LNDIYINIFLSGPESKRHVLNALPTPRDLYTTYLAAFKALVTEANVQEVMCAYNRVNGQPACANDLLLVCLQ
jgi:beta-glucosidase